MFKSFCGSFIVSSCLLLLQVTNLLGQTPTNAQELAALQGTWTLSKVVKFKGEVPAPKMLLTIKDSTWKSIMDNNIKYTMNIDTSMNPKTLDLTNKNGTTIRQIIYKLDGDTLMIAFRNGGRPTELKPDEENATQILVFKRDRK